MDPLIAKHCDAINAIAAAPDGQTASVSFAVAVEWVPRGILRSWRLEWLRGLAGEPPQ